MHQRKTKHFIVKLSAQPFMVLQTILKSMGGADHGQVPQGHSLSGIIEYANGNKPQEWSGYQQFSAALGKWI